MAPASSSSFMLGLLALLVGLLISGQDVEAAVSCNEVVSNLTPCVSYVTTGGSPSQQCCAGVHYLYKAAQTTADRQGVCRCLKSVISSVSYNQNSINYAAALPSKCGVNLPYKISPSTDCNSVTK